MENAVNQDVFRYAVCSHVCHDSPSGPRGLRDRLEELLDRVPLDVTAEIRTLLALLRENETSTPLPHLLEAVACAAAILARTHAGLHGVIEFRPLVAPDGACTVFVVNGADVAAYQRDTALMLEVSVALEIAELREMMPAEVSF